MPTKAHRPSRRHRPTIRDVARRAGVSPSTVSRVMSGSEVVAPATRDRVRRAIEESGFIPSTLARSLSVGRDPVVGLVVPALANPVFPTWADHLDHVLAARHRTILLLFTHDKGGEEVAAARRLLGRQPAGVVFVGGEFAKKDGTRTHYELLAGARIPYVFLGSSPDREDDPAVHVDERAAGAAAARHLVALGHRRLGFVGGPLSYRVTRDKLAGMQPVVQAAGARLTPALRGFDFADGLTAAADLLEGPEQPTGIVAASDWLALAVVSAARARGLRVPEDVSVVGFDGSSITSLTDPPLTTVTQPFAPMAEHAVAVLEGAPTRVFTGTLVVRRSTAPAP